MLSECFALFGLLFGSQDTVTGAIHSQDWSHDSVHILKEIC